jgi:hypothetical protein
LRGPLLRRERPFGFSDIRYGPRFAYPVLAAMTISA